MFQQLKHINQKPKPFEFYTAKELWTDPHRAQKMLEHHLDPDVDLSSRKADFIQDSIRWLEASYNINLSTKIIDFGCGPGLYTTTLAEKGAQVTGIDFSMVSLNYAQKTAEEKSLNIEYIHNNYLDVDLEECYDLVIMIFCDFCALSPDQRKKLLGKFRKILKPDGQVLMDVITHKAFDNWQDSAAYTWFSEEGFWSARPHYQFKNSFKYADEQLYLDKYTIIEEDKNYEIYNWLQTFTQNSLSKEFEECGLKIQELYNDVKGSPFENENLEMAVTAKKI